MPELDAVRAIAKERNTLFVDGADGAEVLGIGPGED